MTIKFYASIENIFDIFTLNSSILFLEAYNKETNFQENLNFTFKNIEDERLFLQIKFKDFSKISTYYVIFKFDFLDS